VKLRHAVIYNIYYIAVGKENQVANLINSAKELAHGFSAVGNGDRNGKEKQYGADAVAEMQRLQPRQVLACKRN
jgi:hypothetical protein